VIALLALRSLASRPWRSLFLLFGYALGVGVMIVLLAIGEALLTQARDERLVGGGEITVLPSGMDVEVMKTGGVGGLFFSIEKARFVYRQLLASPRLSRSVRVVAPQITRKLLYVRAAHGAEYAVLATGEVPSRSEALGAVPPLAAGEWRDDAGDRRWIAPAPYQLYSEIDHFHYPPAGLANPESWGEWHYFNVLSADSRRWAFISYIVGGDIRAGDWGGQIAITLRTQGGRTRRFSATIPSDSIGFSTETPDLTMGGATVKLLPIDSSASVRGVARNASYEIHARAREEGGSATVDVNLLVTPVPDALFPGATLASGEFTSGYAVPGLRANASGTICVSGRCERYESAQSYHDHNWGVWRGVRWEWGATRVGSYTLLYGRVEPPRDAGSQPPLFLYLVDSLGFRALFRPREISYVDDRTVTVGGKVIHVPSSAVLADARGRDTIRVELTIEDAIATDTRGPLVERGEARAARMLTTPYFVQMKGRARLSGAVGGQPLGGEGEGFFETYR
jgi:hypothetical protein